MKTQQKWRCPVCKYEYKPALPALEVLCPKPHARGARTMELVEGEPPQSKRKKTHSGN